jgi:hypothetical protein
MTRGVVWWASLALLVGCGSGPVRRDAGTQPIDAPFPVDVPVPPPLDAHVPSPDAVVVTPPDAFVVRADAFFPMDPDAALLAPDAATPGDDAAIVLLDSGPRRDAFTPPASCGTWGGLTTVSVAPVPVSCLPRCSASTLDAVNACPVGDDGTCLFGALDADTTPTVLMSFDTATGTDTLDLDCGLCFDVMRFHCFAEVCPAETPVFFVCDVATDADGCVGEQNALADCLNAIPVGSADETVLNECFNTQVAGCFDPGSGFLPRSHTVPSSAARSVVRVRDIGR